MSIIYTRIDLLNDLFEHLIILLFCWIFIIFLTPSIIREYKYIHSVGMHVG
jgi:competence protein ComGC